MGQGLSIDGSQRGGMAAGSGFASEGGIKKVEKSCKSLFRASRSFTGFVSQTDKDTPLLQLSITYSCSRVPKPPPRIRFLPPTLKIRFHRIKSADPSRSPFHASINQDQPASFRVNCLPLLSLPRARPQQQKSDTPRLGWDVDVPIACRDARIKGRSGQELRFGDT